MSATAARRELIAAKLRGLTSTLDGMSDSDVVHAVEPTITP